MSYNNNRNSFGRGGGGGGGFRGGRGKSYNIVLSTDILFYVDRVQYDSIIINLILKTISMIFKICKIIILIFSLIFVSN